MMTSNKVREISHVTLFLLLPVLFTLVVGSFDCRRRGQDCENGGMCPETSPNCSCQAGWDGYDCTINTNLTGLPICQNVACGEGGTCIAKEDNKTECKCASGFYGANCSLSRYQVECVSGSLKIGINPYGNFSGTVYVKDVRDKCAFVKVDPSASSPDKWEGYFKDVKNIDPSCGNISAVFDPQNKPNVSKPANQTTAYTRIVFVAYENKFMTSLDEVLTFTCIFNTKSVFINQSVGAVALDANDMQQQTTKETLSPVKFDVNPATGSKDMARLGENLTLAFRVDSNSFDGARLESCVIDDTRVNGDKLELISDSCMNDDAKSVLSKPLRMQDDNDTILVDIGIRVFKFLMTNQLGFTCKMKVCPPGYSNDCLPKTCSDSNSNPSGFGRKRRSVDDEGDTVSEVRRVITVVSSSLNPATDEDKPSGNDGQEAASGCVMAKEVAAVLAALGTITVILLVITVILLARTVMTCKSTKSQGESSDTCSNLGQPRAFTRK